MYPPLFPDPPGLTVCGPLGSLPPPPPEPPGEPGSLFEPPAPPPDALIGPKLDPVPLFYCAPPLPTIMEYNPGEELMGNADAVLNPPAPPQPIEKEPGPG